MKLPKIKLPVLSVNQKAVLITIGIVLAIVFTFTMLFTYPAQTVVLTLFIVMLVLLGGFVYFIYSEVLRVINRG